MCNEGRKSSPRVDNPKSNNGKIEKGSVGHNPPSRNESPGRVGSSKPKSKD